MSLVLAYDRDDLPDGYPELWPRFLEQYVEKRTHKRGPNRSADAVKRADRKAYEKRSKDPVWVARRNAARRAAYRRTKAKGGGR